MWGFFTKNIFHSTGDLEVAIETKYLRIPTACWRVGGGVVCQALKNIQDFLQETTPQILIWDNCNSFCKRIIWLNSDSRLKTSVSGSQSNGNKPGAVCGAAYKSYKSLCPGIDTVGVNATYNDGAHATPNMGLECPGPGSFVEYVGWQ